MPSDPEMPATLLEIVEHKRVEIEPIVSDASARELAAALKDSDDPRPFASALAAEDHVSVIAEIKRRSPSAGLIRPEWGREDFAPELIARLYTMHGASAISCLTDEKFFGGHPSFLARIRPHTPLPILRKDFILHPNQVLEARVLGADAVLLIAECLSDDTLAACFNAAEHASLGVLLEIHDEVHLDRSLAAIERTSADTLLGINNRDLTRMVTDLNHTLRVLPRVPDPSRLVSESGIRTHEDLARLAEHNVRIALVGEHLMRHEDPGAALATLLNES